MKKLISVFLSVSILFALPFTAYAKDDKKSSAIDVKAKSYILLCMNTGDVICENNAYEHLSPASVTKIMSILLTLEAIDSGKISLSDKVSASETAVSKGGSQIWLEVGEQMTVDELLKAVVVASANDACTALGEYIAGSDTGFVKMMNDRAKELGLKDTVFENCSGLDDEIKNHYSCAYDLAVIAREVMKHSLILDYSTIWLDSLRDGKTELNNTNKLVKSYNGITGLKTGTTSNAGFCLCATATRDNMNLVAVVLGADTSADRFDGATALLDYGFANYNIVNPKIDKDRITSVKIKMGTEKSIIPTYNNSDEIMLPKGEDELKYEYKLKKSVTAPIKKNDVLGTVLITSGGENIAKIDLVSSKNINKISFSYVFLKLLRTV